MKKLVVALIASAFATVAFAQDKPKVSPDTKPYSPTPPLRRQLKRLLRQRKMRRLRKKMRRLQ